jgi:hypothetical protein
MIAWSRLLAEGATDRLPGASETDGGRTAYERAVGAAGVDTQHGVRVWQRDQPGEVTAGCHGSWAWATERVRDGSGLVRVNPGGSLMRRRRDRCRIASGDWDAEARRA